MKDVGDSINLGIKDQEEACLKGNLDTGMSENVREI